MKTRKWNRYWIALGFLFTVQVCLIFWFMEIEEDEFHIEGLKMIIETIGTACGLLLAVIFFLKSNESSDRQQQQLIQHRESIHSRQIQTILDSNNYQTEVLKSLFESQNRTLKEILTRHFTQNKNDNSGFKTSMRVYEISRLDLKIEELELELKEQYLELEQIKSWQFLRTKEERVKQIRDQNGKIQRTTEDLIQLRKQREELKKQQT